MKKRRFFKGRITAILLALCMVVTLLPVTAFAADTPIDSVAITCSDFSKPSEGIEVGSTAYGASAFSNDPAGAWTVTGVSWETTDTNGKIQAYTDGNVHLNITLTANAGYKFGTETTFGYHAWSGNATINGEAATCSYFDDGNGGAQELVVSTVLPAKQPGGGENPPAQTAPTAKFVVRYANDATGDVYYKIDNAENWTKANLTEVIETTGQKHFEASISETLSKDSVVHFKAIPGNGFGIEGNQGVHVQAGPDGAMIENGATDIVTENGISYTLENNVDYSFEFSFDRAGGPAPGGNTDGPDAAPAADAAKLQFYDRQNNNITYDEFKRANLGTVEYSFDGNTWNEFTSTQVTSDEKLFWYTDKSDLEPANWNQIYYFSERPVKIRVTEGALRWSPFEDVSFSFNFENNVPVECYRTSGLTYDNLYILPQDDGVRNITWSDDAQEASQRVENGKVIIEKAVIGEENALITDGQYSQQGNKGYVGVKGGATVTVKLIPDYGYQVGTLELNGQKLTSQDEEATYTFTMPDTNLHLRAIFEASSDEIKADAASVTGGSITGGEKVIDSGNLRLSVIDSNMTAEQKAQMQNSEAAKDTDILRYLEVDLEKFVNKGNSGEEWTEDLEELTSKIKITLNVGTDLDANKTYVVVREHNGVYEQIPATYDKAAGTLTFESDKFSDYALATVSDDTPVHTHTYGDWKSDGTNHWKECSCGNKTDVAAHDFKWVVDKEATAASAGSKHEECKTCGYKKAAVTISATGTDNPQTGDNSDMALWFALLFVSCSSVVGTTIYSKKRKAER